VVESGATGADLTELEIEILIAAAEIDPPRIRSYRTTGSEDGEIKAGNSRMEGGDAVDAVDRLLEIGFVEPADESGFTLTPDGLQTASLLNAIRR
jgi:hypothetical protein